jgi:hypothetical protein
MQPPDRPAVEGRDEDEHHLADHGAEGRHVLPVEDSEADEEAKGDDDPDGGGAVGGAFSISRCIATSFATVSASAVRT